MHEQPRAEEDEQYVIFRILLRHFQTDSIPPCNYQWVQGHGKSGMQIRGRAEIAVRYVPFNLKNLGNVC
jgi:hypothetical protein